MNTKSLSKVIVAFLLWSTLLLGTTACQPEADGPRAWIDVPLDGASVPAGAVVPVVSHVYAPDGVAEVVLSVNGQAYRRNPPPASDTTLSKVAQDWTPPQAGDYVLQVMAYSKNGQASNPATVHVKVLGKTTPTPTPPPALGKATPTATLPSISADRTVSPTAVRSSDLALVSVEGMFVGYKGDVALCRPRVVYRNAGVIPVPNDYVIQLSINGTPQMTMTRGAGFGVGGTSEAIFDYTFEGTVYLGVNLDSTSAVNESDEANNAFAEARTCSGPPTTGTPTLTPTRTPTIVPPVTGCSGMPVIASFSASPATITAGNATTLSWGAVTNADSVTIEPGIGGVAAPGSRSVAPATTTTYTLIARCGNQTQTRQTIVTVLPVAQIITPTFTPTRTRTPTTKPDTQGPPTPALVAPKGTLSCRTSVTLDWNAVSDPSGIKHYVVKWVRNDGQSGGTVTTGTQHTLAVTCGKSYTWSVQAVDNAGNAGGTGSTSFTIQVGLY